MSNRYFARITKHNIKTESDNGEDRNRHAEMQIIRACHAKGEKCNRRNGQDPEESRHRAQTFLMAALPKSPEGFSERTINNSKRPGTSLYPVEM